MHPRIIAAQLPSSNQQQISVRSYGRILEQSYLYTLEILDENFRCQFNAFISSTQSRRQAGRQWTKIDSMHRFLNLVQSQTFGKRVYAGAIWSKTQTQIQDPFGAEKLFDELTFHTSEKIAQSAIVLHACLQFE